MLNIFMKIISLVTINNKSKYYLASTIYGCRETTTIDRNY